MAVNVSTFGSVCLYCKTNSEIDAGKDFHEIYDEVGLELQLPDLVETFFHIKVRNDGAKQLCDDCVNRLIELYDLEEHAKEESKSTDLGRAEKINVKTTEANARNQIILESPITIQCRNLKEYALTPSDSVNIRQQNGKKNIDVHKHESVENLVDSEGPEPFAIAHMQDDDSVTENFIEEEFVILDENEDSQDMSETTSNSIIEVESGCSEQIEFLDDDGNQTLGIVNLDTNSLSNTGKLEVLRECKMKTSGNDIQHSDTENEATEFTSNCSNPNDIINEIAYKEELEADGRNNLKSGNDQEIDVEGICVDTIEDIYYEEDSSMNEAKYCLNEITNTVENKNQSSSEEEIENIQETTTASNSCIEKEAQVCSAENDLEKEISNDGFSLEEEYLIEEITCAEEYDDIDLNKYLNKVLLTKFHDLQLNWQTECKLCQANCNNLEELLSHSCITELEEEQQFCCVIKNCFENMNDLASFARHLILMHYDKLESLKIYGKCPDCQKTFSNIIDFNKHSCCRTIKRKPGSRNYCQYCDMDFQSLKRYVFHMQFHLTNRRPKVCLLCGDLFNNSNDFFEHTQYQHMAESSMACIKCDRFFKDKDVFESHMDLHVDSKYQYSCTFCPKKYTNKFGLTQHMDVYHNNKSHVFRCSDCNKEFVTKSSYRNHIKCHATDVQVESYICSTCGIINNDLGFMKNHIESDEDAPCFSSSIEEETLGMCYTCENCSLDFRTIKDLRSHRLSESHKDDLFHCGICRQTFKSLRHMRNHSINHKDFKQRQEAFPITRFYVCNIGDCEEFYPIWTSLYYHKKRPHKTAESSATSSKLKCQFCLQLFATKMSLAVHVARSHNNSNVKCSHCKRSFKSEKLLQDHINFYHTPVECDMCYKKFKHRRNLQSHNNMVHLNIKRYFCSHCDKGYFHKSERDIHENKVHPDISYKCEICNFTTNYSESLKIHMDKHNNQLKFRCTICGKSFGRKQLLKCHLKRHLNEKNYSCAKYLNESGCNEVFLTCNLLKRHIQSKHPNSSYNINLQRDKQLKKSLNKYPESDQTENISYEIIDDDDSSCTSVRSCKSSDLMQLNDTKFDGDSIVLVLENDIEFDE